MRHAHWLGVLAVTLGVSGCKLDLDEGLIGRSADSGAGTGASGGAGAAGGASGGAGANGGSAGGGGTAGTLDLDASAPDSSACELASGCTEPTHACLTPICLAGECAYEVCPPDGCTARTCGTTDRCDLTPSTYGFSVHQFTVGDAIGCGGNASACMAAMDNLLFIGTETQGVLAWNMTNPASPRPITIRRPAFTVARLVASAGRLWMIGSNQGNTLPVAWLNRPTAVRLGTLSTESVGLNTSASPATLYPSTPGRAFGVAASLADYQAGILDTPLVGGADYLPYGAVTSHDSSRVVASSGTRLISFSSTSLIPEISFQEHAGTPTAQNTEAVSLEPQAGNVPTSTNAHRFASGVNGAVLWVTNRVVDDTGNGVTFGAHAYWLVADSSATEFNAAAQVQVASYPSGYSYNTALAGPAAILNDTHAIVSVTDPSNTSHTLVHGLAFDGTNLSLTAGQLRILASPSTLAAAAGLHFGYILAASSQTVYIVAPGC